MLLHRMVTDALREGIYGSKCYEVLHTVRVSHHLCTFDVSLHHDSPTFNICEIFEQHHHEHLDGYHRRHTMSSGPNHRL